MSQIKEILSKYKNIAILGASTDLSKASSVVMKFMKEYGYKVYPVNPAAVGQKIFNEQVFAKLTDIKEKVDIVDVFRPSEEVEEIAKDAIKIGANVLWLQLGITNKNAEKLVLENGISYIENKCTKIEYEKLFLNE
tara:strand:+ start:584 stop:991 length:408 start_codon:yes stop_codon:yes gene_type:complete